MNYNYNYNGNRGYNNQGCPNQGFNNRNQNQQPKKKSGAKEVKGVTFDGVEYFGVVAWFYRKSCGLVKINAFENRKSKHYITEKNRKRVVSLLFEVFYKNSGGKRLEIGFYYLDTGKVVLPNTGIVISTKAPNGGYAGFYQKKK